MVPFAVTAQTVPEKEVRLTLIYKLRMLRKEEMGRKVSRKSYVSFVARNKKYPFRSIGKARV